MRLNKLFAIQEPFYVLGTSMLLQYALLMLTPIIGLMLNIPIGFWHFPFSMGLFFVANGIFQTKVNGLNKWQSIAMAGLSSALLFIAFAYASMYHETCFDAIWYHHDAVYLLAKGWNPFYENLLPEQTAYCQYYLNHFPIGHWAYGAVVYAYSQHIEWAKGIALYSTIFTAFILSGGLLQQLFKGNKIFLVFIGILIALNPLALLNFTTFYVDGILANILSLAILFWLMVCKTPQLRFWVPAFILTCLLAYLKLTGTAFSILLLAVTACYLIITQKKQRIKWFLRFGLFSVVVYVVIGFHPFVSNYLHKGHPFFPAVPNSEINFFAESNYPQNFIGKNRFEKFGMALFSKPGWWRTPESSQYKKPFEIVSDACYAYGFPDIGAMGTLFPELLCASLLLFVIALFKTAEKQMRWKWLLGLLLFLGSVFINQEAWIFRYIPHLWLICILLLIYSWQIVYLRIIVAIVLIGLFANGMLLFRESLMGQSKQTTSLNQTLEQLKHHEKEYHIDFGWAQSFKYRLAEQGLDTSQLTWISPTDTPYFTIPGSLGGKFKPKEALQQK